MSGTDYRDLILDQCVTLLGQIEGITQAVRNRADVIGKSRPAIIVHDGTESVEIQPDRQPRLGVAVMNLIPQISLLISLPTDDWGPILAKYRSLIIQAMVNDATLIGYAFNGEIKYDGCSTAPPATSDQKEGQMDFDFTIRYVLRVADLQGS
jgi:hypothetical protein